MTHVGRLGVGTQVSEVVEEEGELPQLPELGLAMRRAAQLQEEVGQNGREVRVPHPLPIPIDGPLHERRSRSDSRQGKRHAQPAIVVAMYPDPLRAELLHHARDNVAELVDHRAAVGIAEGEVARSAPERRRQRAQRVVGIRLVAVEKMLRVVDHLAPRPHQMAGRVLDHREILL